LRDEQWERIEGLLPGRKGHAGVTARDNRLFVEAVLYRYRAGIAERDRPERFGDLSGVHLRNSLLKAGKPDGTPPRSRRKDQRDCDRHLYKARHLIENFFASSSNIAALPRDMTRPLAASLVPFIWSLRSFGSIDDKP